MAHAATSCCAVLGAARFWGGPAVFPTEVRRGDETGGAGGGAGLSVSLDTMGGSLVSARGDSPRRAMKSDIIFLSSGFIGRRSEKDAPPALTIGDAFFRPSSAPCTVGSIIYFVRDRPSPRSLPD